MRLPIIEGLIDRRALINFRADPQAVQRLLPAPFRPKLHADQAIVGICLIRLKDVRPRGFPAFVGIGSENAAHRIAVEWDQDGGVREGVYIPRRDSDSRLNALAGGRIFPGLHHPAEFQVLETQDRIEIGLRSRDGGTEVHVTGRVAGALPATSIFGTLEAASKFFEAGSLGYSATRESSTFDGLELVCRNWDVEALAMEGVYSSFFEDRERFPEGSVTFDCGLLMRGIRHEWHSREDLCCASTSPG